MPLTVLNVAYPLAPVGPDAVGGAEQVLTRLDEALARAGHHSLVVACQGSAVFGTLLPTPAAPRRLDSAARQAAQAATRLAIDRALRHWAVDLVHLHGVDFPEYLPPPGVPVLVTLHLPPQWYPPAVFRLERPQTFLHCVSAAQHRQCPPCAFLLDPIDNAVPDELFRTRHAKRGFALSLGRICPEKGFHLAVEAAQLAGLPWLLAGELFGYPAHRDYFARELQPRLDRQRRFIGPVGCRRKRRLLSAATCLLAPSLVPETSSLVALEALACGTPVVAFPSGALADIVQHGKNGFLVADVREMAEAVPATAALNRLACRESCRQRFSLTRMVEKYFSVYRRLVSAPVALPAPLRVPGPVGRTSPD